MSIKNKIIPTILGVVAMVTVVTFGGYAWLKESPVYALAKMHISKQKAKAASDSHFTFAWWKSWSYSDEANGHARFVVCESDTCYRVIASKKGDIWMLDSVALQ
jgi:hypothetical protein